MPVINRYIPADCPFEMSEMIEDLAFTGRHVEYTNADTWYPTWASDGNLYSPWTDGEVNGVISNSAGRNAATGYARIIGDDPMKLRFENVGTVPGDPHPYAGRYPCGSLIHNGKWYYGTYCLHPSPSTPHEGQIYNWPWLGPLVGFRYSLDFGTTWTESPHTPERPLFGESALNGEPVKIGAPHFVDFGRNMEHSPDGNAYLVAHGASANDPAPRFGNCSWITGDRIYLARVKPSMENINDRGKYEFFGGRDERNNVVWTRDFSRLEPIAEWNNHMGCVTMTYNAKLRRYLMCVTDGGNTVSKYDTYILESDEITGPWKMAAYLKEFGEQAYFVNIPAKFISADGRIFWLCYSANYTNGFLGTKYESSPPGSRYGMCLQEGVLQTPQ